MPEDGAAVPGDAPPNSIAAASARPARTTAIRPFVGRASRPARIRSSRDRVGAAAWHATPSRARDLSTSVNDLQQVAHDHVAAADGQVVRVGHPLDERDLLDALAEAVAWGEEGEVDDARLQPAAAHERGRALLREQRGLQ